MSDEDARLARLLSTHSPFEAEVIVAILKDAGIEATAVGARTPPLATGMRAGLWPIKPQVHIEVWETDLEAARRLLAERAAQAAEIDWDTVDIGEREDSLPLRQPGRMPIAAQIGCAIAGLLLLASIVGGLVLSFTSP